MGLTLANEGLSLGADGVSAYFAWFRIEKVEVAELRLVAGETELRGSVAGNVIDGTLQAVLASGEISSLELSAPDLLMEGLPAIRAEVLHRFDDASGFADFELPEFSLSSENPLSSFLSPDLPQGDMVTGSIAGTNPTVNPDQPINLNVNIADNIRELLRSLRAGREITRVLEEQLDRR